MDKSVENVHVHFRGGTLPPAREAPMVCTLFLPLSSSRQQDSNSWQLDCLLVLTEAAAESDTLFLTEQPSTALTLQLIT